MSGPAESGKGRGLNREVCAGLAVAALGGVLLFGLRGISMGAGYDRIGPRFFPYAVALGLLLVGGWLAVSELVSAGRDAHAQVTSAAAPPAGRHPAGYLAAALLVNLALIERAGFVLASSAQFWLMARAFRSQRPARDALVAVLLSLLCYLGFSRGLGLTLPSGFLEGIL